MTRHDPFDEALSTALRGAPPVCDSAHPSEITLAAYLDRALSPAEQGRAEAHLEACTSCRALVSQTAAALGVRPVQFPGSRRSLRRAVLAASAASLFIVLSGTLFVWLQGGQERMTLSDAGVTQEMVQRAGTSIVLRAEKALVGELPVAPGLSSFAPSGERTLLRAASARVAPLPLSPRWAIVREDRPFFLWSALEQPGEGGAHYELFVVDEFESFVAAIPLPAQGSSGAAPGVRWPEGQPVFEAGKLYLWKVNATVDHEVVASEYVPFRVLDAEGEAEIDNELRLAEESPFLRAVVLGSHGLDEEALAELVRMRGGEESERAARSLCESILTRSGLASSSSTRCRERLSSGRR